MPIFFSCGCGEKYRVQEELAGKKVRCRQCGELLIVPLAEPKVADVDWSDVDDTPPSTPRRLPPKRSRSSKNVEAERKAEPPREKPSVFGGPTLEERMAARAAETEDEERRSLGRPLK